MQSKFLLLHGIFLGERTVSKCMEYINFSYSIFKFLDRRSHLEKNLCKKNLQLIRFPSICSWVFGVAENMGLYKIVIFFLHLQGFSEGKKGSRSFSALKDSVMRQLYSHPLAHVGEGTVPHSAEDYVGAFGNG